jgi:hypothetical protein
MNFVRYTTPEGGVVPGIFVRGYQANGTASTDQSGTVTGDIIVIGTASGQPTALSGVTKGGGAGQFAFAAALA